MTTERDQYWFDYVSTAPESGDEALRETLTHACPGCSEDLARAEALAASLALSLNRVAPPPELKERMMKRLTPAAALKGRVLGRVGSPSDNADRTHGGSSFSSLAQMGSSQLGLPPAKPNSLSTSRPAPYSKKWMVLAVGMGVFVCALTLLTWLHFSAEQRVEERLAALQQAQKENATGMTEALERLARTRLMADALREKANQISVLERRNRDLEVELAAAKGPDPLILQAMREELEILQSPQLELYALKTTANADARLHLLWDKTGNRWMITGHAIPKLADNRCYGIWMKTEDGRLLPSVTFKPDENGNVRVMMDVPVNDIMTGVSVSDEPIGGAAKMTGNVHFQLDLI
jgi:Anti-sigma-K factor rskA